MRQGQDVRVLSKPATSELEEFGIIGPENRGIGQIPCDGALLPGDGALQMPHRSAVAGPSRIQEFDQTSFENLDGSLLILGPRVRPPNCSLNTRSNSVAKARELAPCPKAGASYFENEYRVPL